MPIKRDSLSSLGGRDEPSTDFSAHYAFLTFLQNELPSLETGNHVFCCLILIWDSLKKIVDGCSLSTYQIWGPPYFLWAIFS